MSAETDRLNDLVVPELKKVFPFPIRGERISLVLGMVHAALLSIYVGATPLVSPDLIPAWLMIGAVISDQLVERLSPALRRTDNSTFKALAAIANGESDAFFHLGRDFKILSDVVGEWGRLSQGESSLSDQHRLAALEDNIVDREFAHELWRLFQLYDKDRSSYAAFLNERIQMIEQLVVQYKQRTFRPTQMGAARMIASEGNGLNSRAFADLFGYVENGEPVVVYVIRAFNESPSSGRRRSLYEIFLARLKKYSEAFDAIRQPRPAFR